MIDFEKYYIKDDYETAVEGSTGEAIAGIVATLATIIGFTGYRAIKSHKAKKDQEKAQLNANKASMDYHVKERTKEMGACREFLSRKYPKVLEDIENGRLKSFTLRSEIQSSITKDINDLLKNYVSNPTLKKELDNDIQRSINSFKESRWYKPGMMLKSVNINKSVKPHEITKLTDAYSIFTDDSDQSIVAGMRTPENILKALRLKYSEYIDSRLLNFYATTDDFDEDTHPDEIAGDLFDDAGVIVVSYRDACDIIT